MADEEKIRKIKMLIGNSNQEKAEKSVGAINNALKQYGLVIDTYNIRTSKRGFLELCERETDVDAYLLSESFGPKEEEAVTPEELEKIRILNPDGIIVLVSYETRGSDYLDRLVAKDVLNALLDDDASWAKIASRIANPLGRGDAISYYGVGGHSVSHVQEGGDRAEQIALFISQATDSTELRERITQSFQDLTPNEKIAVLVKLPLQKLREIAKIDIYHEVAELAIVQKNEVKSGRDTMDTEALDVSEVAAAQESERKNKGGKKKQQERKTGRGKGLRADAVLNRPDIRNIAFVSTADGVGCTYNALMCAYTLQQDYKVAVLEANNGAGHFETLYRELKGEAARSDGQHFEFGGVDFFFNIPISEYEDKYRGQYDYVIYDVGYYDPDEEDSIASQVIEFLEEHVDRMFLVTSYAEYRHEEYRKMMQVVKDADITRKFCIIVSLAEGENVGWEAEEADGRRVEMVGFERSPYNPGKKTRSLYETYLFSEPKKAESGKPVDITKRLTEKPRESTSTLTYILGGIAAALLIVMFIVIGSERASASAKVAEAQSAAIDISENLERSKRQVSDLTEQLNSMNVTVFKLVRPVAAGTEITEDMIHEVTIRTDLPPETYAKKEDIVGKIAVTNISADVPLYQYFVAREAWEELPPFFREDILYQEPTEAVTVPETETASEAGDTSREAEETEEETVMEEE